MASPPRKPLRKSSSLVLNEPDASKLKAKAARIFPPLPAYQTEWEEVPDSEEERLNHRSEAETDASEAEVVKHLIVKRDVIEISSDEEDEAPGPSKSKKPLPRDPITPKRRRPALGASRTPTARRRSPKKGREVSIVSHDSDSDQATTTRKEFLPLFRDDSDDEVQVPSSSKQTDVPRLEDIDWDDSDAILHVNTPKSNRTLKRPINPTKPKPIPWNLDLVPSSSPTDTPTTSQPATPSRSGRSSPTKGSPKKPRAPTKKALEDAEAARRQAYALDMFQQLNRDVFGNALPADTPLVWNPRLLKTAGNARYRKTADGKVTTCIHLASKILDCDERIRFTLGHEMCHLATWVIDHDLDSNHDKRFWKWGNKMMRRRPDITVTTTHNYEIHCNYKWECLNKDCGKIFGRHSKSINIEVDLCKCGGELKELFTTRKRRDPDTSKTSKQAAAKPQESAVQRTVESAPGVAGPGPSSSAFVQAMVIDLTDSGDEDDDIEVLTQTLESASI